MKKISLALSFLLFSNINLYASYLTDADIVTILTKFDTIEKELSKNPSDAKFTLTQLQIKYGMCEDFGLVFGKRYNDLKTKIITELKKTEQEEKASTTETLVTPEESVQANFQQIIVSASCPGILPPRTYLNTITLSLDPEKTAKEALEKALNKKKEDLLKNIVPADQIHLHTIKVVNIDACVAESYSNKNFDTRYNSKYFYMKPLELNLDKLQFCTSSMLSVSVYKNTN